MKTLDDGIISLKTKFGNQSVLSPGLDVSDLRNTLFKNNEIFTLPNDLLQRAKSRGH